MESDLLQQAHRYVGMRNLPLMRLDCCRLCRTTVLCTKRCPCVEGLRKEMAPLIDFVGHTADQLYFNAERRTAHLLHD